MNVVSGNLNSNIVVGVDFIRDQSCADLVLRALTNHHISCVQISDQTHLNIVSHEKLVQSKTIVINDKRPKSGIWCRRSALSASRTLPDEFLKASHYHITDQIGLFAACHDLSRFIDREPKEIGLVRLMNWGYHSIADIKFIDSKLRISEFKYGLVLRSNDSSYDFGNKFHCRDICVDRCKLTSFAFVIGAIQ